jgi:DNA repair exonuclease SbcCD ATPase subunit
LEHLQNHDRAECPKCNHVWFRGYDEPTHRRLLEDIENTSKLHQNASGELKKVREYIEKAKEYMELYRSYITITRASPNLEVFWKYLSDSSIVFDSPRQAVTKLEVFKQDLIQSVKIEDLKLKLQESLDLKMLLSRNQEVNFVKLQEESEKSDRELYRLNQTLRADKERLEAVKRLKSWLETYQLNIRSMQENLDERDQQQSQLFEIFRREALNTCIQATQKELAVREQAISRIDIQKALVNNINEQVVEMTDKAQVLKMALVALSPSEGLIAQGLTGFINHFVAQVNSFIKKVWLYPMELVPITIDEDDTLDLDYNFQVRINEDVVNDPIPDISDTSSGMKEIIDLAFRIVSMQYLGLSDFPIYLDEFGARLDAAHRDSVHFAITNLLTSADFSQIYMISHYEQSYGSLANTDVAVLCEQNIGLSKGTVFNKHVVLQ